LSGAFGYTQGNGKKEWLLQAPQLQGVQLQARGKGKSIGSKETEQKVQVNAGGA
jgi:hypothetical protein